MSRIEDLTPEARAALLNFAASRQGAKLPQGVAGRVVVELRDASLINVRHNLTARGATVRQAVLDAVLDAL